MKGRYYQIDIMKIISSIYVVTIHFMMYYRVQDGEIAYNVILGECFARCCVPVFFLCTGYVLFRKKQSIKTIYRKCFFNIILPTLLMTCILFVFSGKLENTNTILGCIKTINKESAINWLKVLVRWDIGNVNYGFYLWYMISMLKIYIAYPVISLLCVNEKKMNSIRRYVIAIGFIAEILFPTVSYLSQNAMWFGSYSIFGDYCFVYVFLGYELYLFFGEKKAEKKLVWMGLGIYLASNVLNYIFILMFDIYPDQIFDERLYNYNSILVFLSALAFFVMCRNVEIKNVKIQKGISFLGKRALDLYLLHFPVILVFKAYGIETMMLQNVPRKVFYILGILLIYAITMLLAIGLYAVKQAGGHLIIRCNRIKRNNLQ